MKRLIVAILCLLPVTTFSQGLALSNQAQISVITLGPDQDDVVQAFGHTAIRIVDPVLGMDHAYNYGVFSFDQPNFYLNFARGHNYYYLGIASYPAFRDVYIYYHRSVREQVLNLTQAQKQKVFDYLQWNARPANRNYLYDYFFNNCATKIRDLFTRELNGEIHFDSSFIKTDFTLRDLMNSYLDPLPWSALGLNLGLALPIDRKATRMEYMYLPDYVESFLEHATIIQDGKVVPLVKSRIVVFDPPHEEPSHLLIHPWLAFGTLLAVALGLTYWDWKRKKLSIWFDFILLSVVGLLGVTVLLLWTATDHHATAKNFNLLWALPTHLVVAFFMFKKNKPNWIRIYFLVAGLINSLLLILWPVLPQPLNHFLIPVVIALLVRDLVIFKLSTKPNLPN